MSRALAVLGAALWIGAMAASPPLVLAGSAALAVGALWFQWRGRTTASLLLWAAAVAALAWGRGNLALAGLGFALQVMGTAQAPGPRSVALSSWMLGLATLVAVAAVLFWVPLRGSLLGAGTVLPLVLVLAGLGGVLALVVLRDDGPPARPPAAGGDRP